MFVYLAPLFTALGLVWLVPSERLSAVQWVGILLGFAGVAAAFSEGFSAQADTPSTLIGDACGVLAAAFWGATTVAIRASRLAQASATKALFYQLGASAPMLFAASFAVGEPGVVRLDALTVAMIGYQAVIVGFASLLAWFWLLTQYLAARLAVFSFLTPLFGVAAGVIVLDEPLTLALLAGAVAVGVGISLVNLRSAVRSTEAARATP